MSSTSVAVEQKSIPKQQVIKERRTDIARRRPSKSSNYGWLKAKMYHQAVETAKSVLLVFACLSVYKLTGLHDWWMHFVGKLW